MESDIPVMANVRIDDEKGTPPAGVAVVLALVVSLAALAIVSKRHVAPHFWIATIAFLTPIPIALLFRKKIASVAVWLYVAAVLLLLVAAVLFGI